MAVLAFNALIGLIKDGGAREEGLTNAISYDGPLNALPMLWGALTVSAVAFVCVAIRFLPKPNRYLLMLVGLSLLSAAWSDVPKAAIGGALLLAAAYALIIVHVRLMRPDAVIQTALRCLFVFEVLSILFVLLVPDYGVAVGDHAGKWQGVFTHKNGLGSFAAIAFWLSYWDWLMRSRKFSVLVALCAVILVIGSQSATAILIVAALMVFLSACRVESICNALYRFRVPIVLGVMLASVLIVYVSVTYDFGSTDEKYGTFSNRNLIWLYMLGKVALSPWVGYGLEQLSVMNSANGDDFASGVGFLVASAHNGFLELLFALGVAGVALVTVLLVSFVANLRRDALFPLMMGYVCLFILENTSESRLLGLNGDFIALLYLIELSTGHRRAVAWSAARSTAAGVARRPA
jgi:O-antigen ligase